MPLFEKDLNWEIEQKPIYNINSEVIPGYQEIRRIGEAQNNLLSVMKDSYYPVNISRFKSIAETISKETDMELAGYNMFKEGRVVTAQLKSDKPFVIGGSVIEGYLTIGTGFDGSQSFFIGYTSEFLRCMNQFGRIITSFTSRLTKNNNQRIDEILENLIMYNAYEKELYESFEKMEKVPISAELTKACIERLANLSQEERLDNSLITANTHEKLIGLKESILTECNDLGDNAFGLFNGITRYTTHRMKVREKDVFGNILTRRGEINTRGYNLIMNELVM